MKNFPHQYSQIDRLTDALRVAEKVIKSGGQLGDDAVFGEALVFGNVHNIAGDGTLAERLKNEKLKPVSNRGYHTAAREMRRFLVLAKFLEQSAATGAYQITANGVELLKSDNPLVYKQLWREGVSGIELNDAGNVSHPYRIMMRLVQDRPGIAVKKLLLALEARNDGSAEYKRILDLSTSPFEDILASLNISSASAANAIKILPSIAQQVGDLEKRQNQAWISERVDVSEDEVAIETNVNAGATTSNSSNRRSRDVDAKTIASEPAFQNTAGSKKFDLAAAIALRQRRHVIHQRAVKSMANKFEALGFTLSEHPFDCFGQRKKHSILVEMKTLDGSPSDERKQAERALGQIQAYRHFDLPEDKKKNLILIVAFSQKPITEICNFLNIQGVFAAYPSHADEWILVDPAGKETQLSDGAWMKS
ncbi:MULTISPECIES: hypothetical protein [unclassified Phyllobacterium]|uniref:hypothetical protein n=1 Tax=unclassified Phyllobacterium TaxID=2638441 RepID=UPI003012EC79